MGADDRIPTEIWVAAQLRRCSSQALPAYLLRRGSLAGGLVSVKTIDSLRQCQVFTQSRNFEGESGWIRAFPAGRVDEAQADAYIERAIGRDPDLWVVEVETPDGALPFEGAVFL